MCIKPIVWKDSKAAYSNTKNAWCGHIQIGSVSYDGITCESDKYKAYSRLPSVMQPKANFSAESDAIAWVEYAFKKWCEQITN